MPELPEVETVKRVIEPQLSGRTVTALRLNRPDIISYPAAEKFAVVGKTISHMGRRGKFLSIHLTDGSVLKLHLRMTGSLLVTSPDFPIIKHTHIIFSLDNDTELRFIDQRRFGCFWLFSKDEEDTVSGVSKLGLEPFDDEFCCEYLRSKLSKRRKPIKECLLEQNVVCGIGNIYGDEILFASSILPDRPALSLSDAEWQTLSENIPKILKKAIDDNTITPEEYLLTRGEEYKNTPFLTVYDRGGLPCLNCGEALKKITLSGRSSVFCPKCQK